MLYDVAPKNDFYAAYDMENGGAFGIPHKAEGKRLNVNWYGCREDFQTSSKKIEHFVFRQEVGTYRRVIKFMERIQKDLQLKKKSCLKFSKTTDDKITYIVMSAWWLRPERRSLLTALLRAGQHYKRKSSYKSAMRKIEYLDDTMPAVERFLEGYTKARSKWDNHYGWYDELEGLTKDEMKKALKK